ECTTRHGSDLAVRVVERNVRAMKSAAAALAATIMLLALTATPAPAQDPGAASSNPFFGSIPKGTPTAQPMPLSVKDAVGRALQNNLGLLIQEESEASAHGARWRALADLLPNLSGSLASRRQVINLEAYGFPSPQPIVGPFNVHDARVYLSQPIIDLSAMNDARASASNLQAEKYGVKTAR